MELSISEPAMRCALRGLASYRRYLQIATPRLALDGASATRRVVMKTSILSVLGAQPRASRAATTAVVGLMLWFAGTVSAEPGDNHLISVDPATGRAAGNSEFNAVPTRDGRYVAFDSRSARLAAGDTNDFSDASVDDSASGITERVSVGIGGMDPNGGSGSPAISAGGRFVAFESLDRTSSCETTTSRWTSSCETVSMV